MALYKVSFSLVRAHNIRQFGISNPLSFSPLQGERCAAEPLKSLYQEMLPIGSKR